MTATLHTLHTLHAGPLGQKTVAFRELVRLAQRPQTGDGAARSRPQAVAAPPSQPAPSPLSTERGGVR